MKKAKFQILVFVILAKFGLNGLAQQNETKIQGVIHSPDNLPAMFSTVILMNKDSVYMKGTLSREDGSFVIDNLGEGSYFIMVRNIEFQNYISALIPIRKNEIVILDRIELKTSINKLEEVVVSGKKAMIEVHADKMVFNVSSSPNAAGNNGLELLGKAPGVLIDMDNNIVLQGKSGVQIFINGRPTRLSGSDLTNFLESLRSDNIESIEIITNPSSKYEAEGTAGIINIELKKNTSLGFNGNVIAGFSQGVYSRVNSGTSLNYSGEKISLFSSMNLSDDEFQDDFTETSLQNGYLLDKQSRSANNRKTFNFSGGMDYTINDKQSLSLDGRALVNDRNNVLRSTTGIIDTENSDSSEILKSEVLDDTPSSNYIVNLNYRFAPDNSSKLSADFSLGRYTSNKSTDQPNDYIDANDGLILRSIKKQYDADTEIDLSSALVDYEKKFDKITLSTGAKYSFITTGNQLAFYNIENGSPVFDISRSNNFSYEEKVAALYLLLGIKPSERIAFNAGVRMENTASLGFLKSEIPFADSKVPRNYTDFFPNLSFSFDDLKNSVISASIGRRIARPNYQDLNPFESRMSELSTWKGNPFLKPNYITNYQISYSYKRKLVISNNYSITNDFFATIFEISDEKGSVLIPRNMQKATNYALSLSYPLQVFKWWEFSSFFVYNYETYEGSLEGTEIDLKADIYSLRVQNNLKLPANITMELTYFVVSPWIWRGTIEVNGNQGLNFGFKKDFMDRKLLVQLTGSDIFRSRSDYYYKSNYGGMDITGVRTFDNQRFGINVTYNFGNQKAKARKKGKSAIDDDLNRISE